MHEGDFIDTLCQSGDGVYVVDESKNIVRWNPAAEKILKFSESEVMNLKCHDILSGKTPKGSFHCRPDCPVHQNAFISLQKHFDLVTQTKEGEPRWLNISIISPLIHGKRYAAHILRDVSQERKMELAVNRMLSDMGVGVDSREGPHGSPTTDKMEMDESETIGVVNHGSLSRRETQVLRLLAKGHSTKSIAQKLNISHFTARNHIQSILVKLDIHSKAQAVSYAYRMGIL